VVDMADEYPVIVYIPELNQKLLTNGFDCIYPYNTKNVFVAGDRGFTLLITINIKPLPVNHLC
jgi:hypothetical protein